MKPIVALILLLASGMHASATTTAPQTAAANNTTLAQADTENTPDLVRKLYAVTTINKDPHLVASICNTHLLLTPEQECTLLTAAYNEVIVLAHSIQRTEQSLQNVTRLSVGGFLIPQLASDVRKAHISMAIPRAIYIICLQTVSEETFLDHQKTHSDNTAQAPILVTMWQKAAKYRADRPNRLKKQNPFIVEALMQYQSEHSNAFAQLASIINDYVGVPCIIPIPKKKQLTCPQPTQTSTTAVPSSTSTLEPNSNNSCTVS
jgi:hypothetical protein